MFSTVFIVKGEILFAHCFGIEKGTKKHRNWIEYINALLAYKKKVV